MGRQIDPLHAVFGGDNEALGQSIAGHYLTQFLGLGQKGPGAGGGGSIVQIENADDGLFPHRKIITDG